MHTDDNEFNGHEEPEEVEDDLQHRPLGGLHEPPCARGEDEGVPCCDGERADEEVLVRAQMGRQVEGGREERRDIRHCFCLLLRCSSSQQNKKLYRQCVENGREEGGVGFATRTERATQTKREEEGRGAGSGNGYMVAVLMGNHPVGRCQLQVERSFGNHARFSPELPLFSQNSNFPTPSARGCFFFLPFSISSSFLSIKNFCLFLRSSLNNFQHKHTLINIFS